MSMDDLHAENLKHQPIVFPKVATWERQRINALQTDLDALAGRVADLPQFPQRAPRSSDKAAKALTDAAAGTMPGPNRSLLVKGQEARARRRRSL